MNTWGASREVEKVKPFNERAMKAITRIGELRDAMRKLGDNATPIGAALIDAADLLLEAVHRGVKGKDSK